MCLRNGPALKPQLQKIVGRITQRTLHWTTIPTASLLSLGTDGVWRTELIMATKTRGRFGVTGDLVIAWVLTTHDHWITQRILHYFALQLHSLVGGEILHLLSLYIAQLVKQSRSWIPEHKGENFGYRWIFNGFSSVVHCYWSTSKYPGIFFLWIT